MEKSKSIVFVAKNDNILDFQTDETIVRYAFGEMFFVEKCNGFSISKVSVSFDGCDPVFVFGVCPPYRSFNYFYFSSFNSARTFCLSHSIRHTPKYWILYPVKHRELSLSSVLLILYSNSFHHVSHSLSESTFS